MSAHLKEAPLTVDKEYVANLAVTASAKRKELPGQPAAFRYVMMVASHPASIFRKRPSAHAEQMQSPHLGTKWGLYVRSRPECAVALGQLGSGGGSGCRCRGGVPARHCAGGVARLPVVQLAACADHRRPGRLPRPGWSARLVVAARSIPATGPAGRAGFGIRYRRDAGHAGRHRCICSASLSTSSSTEYLTRSPDTAALRHDLHRLPPFYPPGWF